MRVGVVGAGGRMGREVCRAVLATAGLELVTAVDPARAGEPLEALLGDEGSGLVVADAPEALTESGAQVAVDFSRLEAARITLPYCAGAGIHTVVGTTGFTEEDVAALAREFGGPDLGAPNCVLAPNFAIGAVLMMRFAELAAPWFEGVEIIELHHENKLDAPSGTAMATAARMADSRTASEGGGFAADRTTTVVLDGARGGGGPGGVRVHSVRLPGLVAHQEVVFGAPGQGLTIRHDSYDRRSFMDGVIMAVRAVETRPGLTVGLEPLLGL